MQPINPLTQDNIKLLTQAIDVLHQISDAQFTTVVTFAFNSGVCNHFRHSLDFYSAFLQGWQHGKVDYDTRNRDLRIQTEREYAIQKMSEMVTRLQDFGETDPQAQVRVRQDTHLPASDPNAWGASSLQREMQALVSHTIHHYALISVMLRYLGFQTPPDFGVAPSTVEYWRNGR